jgi:hypothetical protein
MKRHYRMRSMSGTFIACETFTPYPEPCLQDNLMHSRHMPISQWLSGFLFISFLEWMRTEQVSYLINIVQLPAASDRQVLVRMILLALPLVHDCLCIHHAR